MRLARYDSDDHRRALESSNNVPVIPGRKNRKIEIVYDKLDTTVLGFIAVPAIKAFNL